jgi:hypothetical protein
MNLRSYLLSVFSYQEEEPDSFPGKRLLKAATLAEDFGLRQQPIFDR